MRKIIIGLVVVIAAVGIAFGIILMKDNSQTDAQSLEALDDNSNTEIEEVNYEPVYYHIIDGTNEYSEEELASLKTEMEELLNAYGSTVFNINSKTEDFTSELQSLYCTDEYFIDKDSLPNIYKEFHGLNMDSTLTSTELYQIKVMENDTIPEVDIFGYFAINMSCSKLEESSYVVPFNAAVYQQNGGWKLGQMTLLKIYDSDGFEVVYEPESENTIISVVGSVALGFDFVTVDDYLNDYQDIDGHSFNPDDYEEVIIMDN